MLFLPLMHNLPRTACGCCRRSLHALFYLFSYTPHTSACLPISSCLYLHNNRFCHHARARSLSGHGEARYFMRRYTPAFREAFSVMGPTGLEPLEDREGSGSFPWRFASPHGLSLMICRTRPAAVSRNACMRCLFVLWALCAVAALLSHIREPYISATVVTIDGFFFAFCRASPVSH